MARQKEIWRPSLYLTSVMNAAFHSCTCQSYLVWFCFLHGCGYNLALVRKFHCKLPVSSQQAYLYTSYWLTKRWPTTEEVLGHCIVYSLCATKAISGTIFQTPKRIPFNSFSHICSISLLVFLCLLFLQGMLPVNLCLIKCSSFYKIQLNSNYWWIAFFFFSGLLFPRKSVLSGLLCLSLGFF